MALLALGGCGQPAPRAGADSNDGFPLVEGVVSSAGAAAVDSAAPRGDRVEVLSFHGRRRCPTCVAIERLTREVVDESFAREVADRRLELRVVEIDREPALAERYRVAWSSLLLHGRSRDADTVVNLTRFAFDNARKNPERFRATLRGEIEKLLRR